TLFRSCVADVSADCSEVFHHAEERAAGRFLAQVSSSHHAGAADGSRGTSGRFVVAAFWAAWGRVQLRPGAPIGGTDLDRSEIGRRSTPSQTTGSKIGRAHV